MSQVNHTTCAPCVWFCGLSGAGKTTVAGSLVHALHAVHVPAVLLDGDILRRGVCSDLGFSDRDRHENLRRIREIAYILAQSGIIPVTSCITPFEEDRKKAQERLASAGMILVFMDTPLEVCQQRDPKKLYARVLKGEIKNFTGVDSIFERPEMPDISVREKSVEEATTMILAHPLLAHWISSFV